MKAFLIDGIVKTIELAREDFQFLTNINSVLPHGASRHTLDEVQNSNFGHANLKGFFAKAAPRLVERQQKLFMCCRSEQCSELASIVVRRLVDHEASEVTDFQPRLDTRISFQATGDIRPVDATEQRANVIAHGFCIDWADSVGLTAWCHPGFLKRNRNWSVWRRTVGSKARLVRSSDGLARTSLLST